MQNRILEFKVSGKRQLDCKFYSGDIKRYCIDASWDDGDLKLSSRGDKIWCGKSVFVSADEIWQEGLLIEHEEPQLSLRLAHLLIYARKISGMTQGQLSQLTGVTQADISKLERGEGNPSLHTIERLLHAMDGNLAMDLKNISGLQGGGKSIADIYALPEDAKVELIDGKLYDMAAPSMVHAMLASFLQGKISSYIEAQKGSCIVVQNAALIMEQDAENYFIPDLMVVCDRDKVKNLWVKGAPDWIIEIVSKQSEKNDYRIKLAKYLQMGVREYWIVDPARKKVVVYAEVDNYMPHIYPIGSAPENHEGLIPVGIYEEKLCIDTGELNKIIEAFFEE